MKTTKQPALRANVFVQAAALLASDTERLGCNAIASAVLRVASGEIQHLDHQWKEWVHTRNNSPYVRFFVKKLKPADAHKTSAWYEHMLPGCIFYSEETQNARIFGLLLCAELVKDEQRAKRRRTKK